MPTGKDKPLARDARDARCRCCAGALLVLRGLAVSPRGLDRYPPYSACTIALDVDEPRAKTHLAAQLADARHNPGDHARQDIRPDMRLGVPKDRARRPCGHKGLEDEPVRRILGARGELAVRERPRSAQAKLDVALGIERARALKAVDGVGAARGVVAALDEKRLEPGLGKGERRKEAGATRAHNHGAVREF